jgi:hypothetical protein
MKWGIESVKDTLDVLIVPVSLGILALVWPAFAARKRRKNFMYLIRKELEEATPEEAQNLPAGAPWHSHLTRRFLHEQIICNPVENTEFVLSLDPKLSYSLSQMWIAYDKGFKQGRSTTKNEAQQWCWYLKSTCVFLDRRRFSSHRLTKNVYGLRRRIFRDKNPNLNRKVYERWRKIIKDKYQDADIPD